jgi:transcription-repair coupling factor (superfamily II helicase)
MSLNGIIRGVEACEKDHQPLNVRILDDGVKDLFLIAAVFYTISPQILLIIPNQKDLEKWAQRLKWLTQGYSTQNLEIVQLPYISNFGPDRYLDHRLHQMQRLSALTQACFPQKKIVFITTITALSQITRSYNDFREVAHTWSIGDDVDTEVLTTQLLDFGYQESPTVEAEGLFAIRGGIIDVFPPGTPHPVRIEVFLDQIKSIRQFNREDQRSIKEVAEVILGPAREFFTHPSERDESVQKYFDLLMASKLAISQSSALIEKFKNQVIDNEALFFMPQAISGCDATIKFFSGQTFCVFPEGKEKVFRVHRELMEELQQLCDEDRSKGRIVNSVENIFSLEIKLSEYFDRNCGFLNFDSLLEGKSIASAESSSNNNFSASRIFAEKNGDDPLETWIKNISRLIESGKNAKILCQNPERIDRIYYLLTGHNIGPIERNNRHLREILSADHQHQSTHIEICLGYISEPISLDSESLALIPDYVLLGIIPQIRGRTKRSAKSAFQSFSDLVPSNLVVHYHHGVGRYKGLSRMAFGEVEAEFLVIEYAGNDKIYLPVDRLNMLSRYDSISEHDRSRPIDKLGGSFAQKKERVKVETLEFAKFLISEQAKRALSRGIVFGQIPDTYFRLEADFPYEETDDQLRAVEDIEADFVSGKPMDRLLCGDVGFGKTEVALRATMRTVLEGYQILIFVPTTLLCHQHFTTFSHRLEKYAVKVAEVNRFVGSKSIKNTLEAFKAGRIDVLVGTHMLLTKNIVPKRLGLLIVDEEQRFGVQHKESLKKIRANAHVLSLSATPIPRTLHQALLGLKEISVIATPPKQRLPVKTYISPFDPQLVKRAVDQELRRGGQVFFVHNRVEEIEGFADDLSKIVPDARIAVAHGQMQEHYLEKIVTQFIEKKFDILLCTTIIEAGVDMPNVNTLIINKADRFGLAQLYQIRGRVGRSHLQAYAYLFFDPQGKISQESRSRLDIIASHQELGAGFHIANRDLEMRGAGDLLGEAQSGHVYEIGLDTYRSLLTEAINKLNGQHIDQTLEVELKLPVKILIPQSYIALENERLKYYKEIFSTSNEEELESIREILEDRFGNPPLEVFSLFKIASIKIQLQKLGISSIIYRSNGLECWFSNINVEVQKNILSLIDRHRERYRPLPKEGLFILAQLSDYIDKPLEFLDKIAIEISHLKYQKATPEV